MSEQVDGLRKQALFGDAQASPIAVNNVAIQARRAAAAAAGSPVPGSAKKSTGATGLLAHRHSLAASAAATARQAGTPGTPGMASPHVQAAFKEIVASPSPKVSTLVERLKQKEAKHVEVRVIERGREQKRAAMIAEAHKVRQARKKAVEESEAKFDEAEQMRKQADSELAKQRQRCDAARHTYNELASSRESVGRSTALGESEKQDCALLAAEEKHKQRVKQAEIARAAMTAARAEHDKALRMEQAFLDINSRPDSEAKLEMEKVSAVPLLSTDQIASPLSGLQVLSPTSSIPGGMPASPCEVAAEEERLAWWAKEEYETVMEEERHREEEERREKMKQLENEEVHRKGAERRLRENRERQEKEAKQCALQEEREARRKFERDEFERQERERADAEHHECLRLERLELEERTQREKLRLKLEQERLERERQERENREMKMTEVESGGRSRVEAVMAEVKQYDLSAAQQSLKALHSYHLAESLFVTDTMRGDEGHASDSVRELEQQHAQVYHERISLIERGEADVDSANTALKVEDLVMARELVCLSLEALKGAAAHCTFAELRASLADRIEADLAQAHALLHEILIRVECDGKAQTLVMSARARLGAGDCVQARALLQEARTALRRAQLTHQDADLKGLAREIDATEQLQMERLFCDAQEERKRLLTNQGEVHLTDASAAMAALDMVKARALLQAARVKFEQAAAPVQLFEEISGMLQRINEAEELMQRKAEIQAQRHQDLSEGQLHLHEARRALEAGDEENVANSILSAKALLQVAKEAFWRAHNSAMDEQVERLEKDIELAQLHEQHRLEACERAAAQVRTAEDAWRRAVEEMAANGNVEEVERLLRSARAALAVFAAVGASARSGFRIQDLQMHLDEADGQLEALVATRVATRDGEELLRQAHAALTRGAPSDMPSAARAIEAARAAFSGCGDKHALALEGLSACRAIEAEYQRVEKRLEVQRQAVLDEVAADEALEEAQIIWEDMRDAERAAELFAKAASLYKKAHNFDKRDQVIEAEATFRAEQEEERLQRAHEEAFKVDQLIEADSLVARARMLVENEMFDDAHLLLARAAEAFTLSGLGEPVEALLEVEGYLKAAEEERNRKQTEAAVTRQNYKRLGDECLASALCLVEAGSNDFDQARGYCKEAGSAFREAGLGAMEEQVLALIQQISDQEDIAVRKLMETERVKREEKLLRQQHAREEAVQTQQKLMEEEAVAAAKAAAEEAEERRRAAVEAEQIQQQQEEAHELQRKTLQLEAVRNEVVRRNTEHSARVDQLAISAQRMVEKAMMAVETGDWEVARGKIADAKDILAAAGMKDSALAALPESVTALEASRKVQKLSDMVRSVSEQLEAAAAAAHRHDLELTLQTAQDDAQEAISKGEWTLARKHLAAAYESAVLLQDASVEERVQGMRRGVDQAQDSYEQAVRAAAAEGVDRERALDQSDAARTHHAAPQQHLPRAPVHDAANHDAHLHERVHSEDLPFERTTRPVAVRAAPPQPDRPHMSEPPQQSEYSQQSHLDRGLSSAAQYLTAPSHSMHARPTPDMMPLVDAGTTIGRPSLGDALDDDGTWHYEREPLSPSLIPTAPPGGWGGGGMENSMQTQHDDGLLKVSMMGHDAQLLPSDNIAHWTEATQTARLPLDFDVTFEAQDGMEDISGGLLGGAMYGLASLTDNSRRSSAFLLAANTSLSQHDLNCILAFAKRAKLSGLYDPDGHDGLMAMLQRGDKRLVNAYRGYEFHRDDATLIDELQDLRRRR